MGYLDAKVHQIRKELSFNPDKGKGRDPAIVEQANRNNQAAIVGHIKELSKILIEPFDRLLRRLNNGSLICVPYGALHELPFHLLISQGTPLGLRKRMSQIPSLTILPSIQKRLDAITSIDLQKSFVFGLDKAIAYQPFGSEFARTQEPLPDVKEEVQTVSGIIKCEKTDEERAWTSSDIMAKLETVDHCYFASHAMYDPVAPLLSGIFLGGKEILTVKDAMSLTRAPPPRLQGCMQHSSQ